MHIQFAKECWVGVVPAHKPIALFYNFDPLIWRSNCGVHWHISKIMLQRAFVRHRKKKLLKCFTAFSDQIFVKPSQFFCFANISSTLSALQILFFFRDLRTINWIINSKTLATVNEDAIKFRTWLAIVSKGMLTLYFMNCNAMK